MGAHKDRLIQAADLLGMTPADLLTLLDSRSAARPAGRNPDRCLADFHAAAQRADWMDAVVQMQTLDCHLRNGGELPAAWRSAGDSRHGEPWPDDSPEGRDVAAMRARPAGSNAPEEDGPHAFEPRDADDAARYGLLADGCDYCGQVAGDPIHGDDEPWPADSPEGRDVTAMRARDDAR